MVIDFRTHFFSPGQVYVALSRVQRSTEVLLIHKKECDPQNARTYQPMIVFVKILVPREAFMFVEGNKMVL